jgi:hypothetical protein
MLILIYTNPTISFILTKTVIFWRMLYFIENDNDKNSVGIVKEPIETG